jgi:hypothetical protein
VNGVYRSVPDRHRLVPRERDPVTGRRTRTRDEKHERRARRPRSRLVVAAAIAAVVVVTAAAVTLAVVLPGSDDDAATRPESGGEAAPTTATDLTGVTPSSVADPPATAITLQYSGGNLTRAICTDLLGGSCTYPWQGQTEYDPLTVRCTPQGCTVTLFETHELGGGLDATGAAPAGDGCEPTVWTLSLDAVGTAVTHGIEHPARLVGTVTQFRPPEVLAAVNCLGGDEEYVYDATPP